MSNKRPHHLVAHGGATCSTRVLAIAAAVLSVVTSSCAPRSLQPAYGVSSQPLAPQAARSYHPKWRGIVIGTTREAYIRDNFIQESSRHYLYGAGEGTFKPFYLENAQANRMVSGILVTPTRPLPERRAREIYGDKYREWRDKEYIRHWRFEAGPHLIFSSDDDSRITHIAFGAIPELGDAHEPKTKRRKTPEHQIARVGELLGKKQSLNWVGIEEERNQAQQYLKLLSRRYNIVDDAEAQMYVDGILRRLTSIISSPPIPWVVNIVDDPSMNAANLGGGIILMHTGLFGHLDGEDEFAFVLAHEVGHQVRRHVAASQTRMQIANTLLTLGTLVAGAKGEPTPLGPLRT